MPRAKGKKKDPLRQHATIDGLSTNIHITISSDGRRLRTTQTDITNVLEPPSMDEAMQSFDPVPSEDVFQDESMTNVFYHQVAGVQVVTKQKRKRYESSVSSTYDHNDILLTGTTGCPIEGISSLSPRVR